MRHVQSKDGKLVNKIDGQVKWWVKHFNEVFNNKKPNNLSEIAEDEGTSPLGIGHQPRRDCKGTQGCEQQNGLKNRQLKWRII